MSPLQCKRDTDSLVFSGLLVYGSKQHRVAHLFYPVVKLDEGLLEVEDVRVHCFFGHWTEFGQ